MSPRGEQTLQDEVKHLRRLLYASAYRLFTSTYFAGDASVNNTLIKTLTHPRVGDLVMETSTLFDAGRDEERMGRLVHATWEPVYTHEAWRAAGGVEGEPIPKERIVYIQLADGREYRWRNAVFIRVLEEASNRTGQDGEPGPVPLGW